MERACAVGSASYFGQRGPWLDPPVVSLSKSRFHRSLYIVYIHSKIVAIKALQSLCLLVKYEVTLNKDYYYLQETMKDVYLVKMFDPVISPRCYGIVATKN